MTTQQQINANLAALGFDNSSTAAIANQIAQAIGLSVDNTVTELNDAINLITALITAKNYGKSDYYTGKALAFQYGDNLVTDPATLDYVYATVDGTKQIISQAAFEEIVSGTDSQLFLKVATTDGVSGNLVGLNPAQLSAFQSYFGTFELPGLPVTIISTNGNTLSFLATASYFKTYDLPTLQTNLSNALTAFRQGYEFDGVFFAGDLESYIKANVPGIRDFYLFNTLVDNTPFNGSQPLTSGYFNYVDTILNQITYAAV